MLIRVYWSYNESKKVYLKTFLKRGYYIDIGLNAEHQQEVVQRFIKQQKNHSGMVLLTPWPHALQHMLPPHCCAPLTSLPCSCCRLLMSINTLRVDFFFCEFFKHWNEKRTLVNDCNLSSPMIYRSKQTRYWIRTRISYTISVSFIIFPYTPRATKVSRYGKVYILVPQ